MSRLAKPSLKTLSVKAAWGFALCVMGIGLLGCPRKGFRTVASTPMPATTGALIAQLSADQLSYTTMAIQYKATLISEERRQNFTLRIHLLKDSLIWLSASLFSIEGARGLIRPDSAFLLQRLEKTFYFGSLDTLRQLFPAYVLSDLANLFLGRWPVGLSALNWMWDPQGHTLSAPYQKASLRASLAPDTPRLVGWKVTFFNGLLLSLTYEWDSHPIPTRITLTLPSDEKLLLQLSDFTPHAPDLSFAFRVPSDYKYRPLFGK